MSKPQVVRYKGHTVTEKVEFGWSDSQQRLVENGFRVVVEGPHFSMNQQSYCGVGHDTYQAIDRAIAKATGGEE